jgi:predicted AlkP superfamily phosphohydrolase/phosphomutase
MESRDINEVLEELKKHLERLNDKMQSEVLTESMKHKQMYKEIIKLAGELNDFFITE